LPSGSAAHFGPIVSNTNLPGITCTPIRMPMAKPASSNQRPCERNVGIDGNGRNGSLRLSPAFLLHIVKLREVFIKAAPSQKGCQVPWQQNNSTAIYFVSEKSQPRYDYQPLGYAHP
jgi:hypothetical protein